MKLVCIFLLNLNIHFINKLNFPSDTTRDIKTFRLYGYLKEFTSLTFNKNFKETIADQVLHHRLNFRWKPFEEITLVTEFRNRFFWGESIKLNPNYSKLLHNSTENWNLREDWINQPGILWHTNTERLYLDYQKAKWQIRLGRQRVNWGMGITWNPNDLFNAYNFLDFDYEERAGIDGVQVRYLINDFSNTEWVYTSNLKGKITAFRYFFNAYQFDIQLTAGSYLGRMVLGSGWSGHLGDAGFRGEIQKYFKNEYISEHHYLSSELDYVFNKGWYGNIGILYNSLGRSSPIKDFSEANLKLTAENLMPSKWNALITIRKELNPLSELQSTLVYSPGTNFLIILNNLSYNFCTDVDVDFIWQSYYATLDDHFQAAKHLLFIRFRWSY